jgi:aspartyl-tRNA(Asn)/glutamyl-tRNA(Gln) amidotransferase subunit C
MNNKGDFKNYKSNNKNKIIDKDEISHIAKLAELEYSDDEIDKITIQLDKILTHIAKIKEADTSNISSTFQSIELSNVFREDEIRNSISREEALKNAPLVDNNGFKVPKID